MVVYSRSVATIGQADPLMHDHRDREFCRLHSYDPDVAYAPKSRTPHGFPRDLPKPHSANPVASNSSESSISSTESVSSEHEGEEVSLGPRGSDPPAAATMIRPDGASVGPPPIDGVQVREHVLAGSAFVDEVSGGVSFVRGTPGPPSLERRNQEPD